MKCQSGGKIYISEEGHNKLAVFLHLHPLALLIIEYQSLRKCFSVVSLHPRPQGYDGKVVGYFSTHRIPVKRPSFTFEPETANQTSPVVVKKKRKTLSETTQVCVEKEISDADAMAAQSQDHVTRRKTLTMRPQLKE